MNDKSRKNFKSSCFCNGESVRPSAASGEIQREFDKIFFELKKITPQYFPEQKKRVWQSIIQCMKYAAEDFSVVLSFFEHYPETGNPYPYASYVNRMVNAFCQFCHAAYLVDGLVAEADEYSGGSLGSQKIKKSLVSEMKFTREDEQRWVKITLNKRLPGIKIANKEYGRYKRALQKAFCEQMEPDRHMRRVFMIFVHHYKETVRDPDNYEEKPLSDLVSEYFLAGGDGPENVQRISRCVADNREYTEVFVVPAEEILAWFQTYNILPNR